MRFGDWLFCSFALLGLSLRAALMAFRQDVPTAFRRPSDGLPTDPVGSVIGMFSRFRRTFRRPSDGLPTGETLGFLSEALELARARVVYNLQEPVLLLENSALLFDFVWARLRRFGILRPSAIHAGAGFDG